MLTKKDGGRSSTQMDEDRESVRSSHHSSIIGSRRSGQGFIQPANPSVAMNEDVSEREDIMQDEIASQSRGGPAGYGRDSSSNGDEPPRFVPPTVNDYGYPP
jgi:hypothetical protein